MLSDGIDGFIYASGNEGFRPINRPCFLEIENFEGVRQREKISQFFRVADIPNDLYFIKSRSGEKTKTGSLIVFQIAVTVA
jgi:hypothetical protein